MKTHNPAMKSFPYRNIIDMISGSEMKGKQTRNQTQNMQRIQWQ